MSTIGELLVLLGVNDAALTAGLARSEAKLRGFGDTAGASGAKASAGLNAAGMASLAVVGATAAIGAESVKMATTYQSSMELLRTQTGASQAEVDSMSTAVLQLATSLPQSPEQLAAGLYHVESAGKRGAAALDILKVAAQGAAMSGADLESVTNALIAADQSGVKGVETMQGAMGSLNAIVGAGNMRMQDLTDAMGTGVLSTAKNYGVTLQSVGAALADMTDQGIPAIDAATRLNSAMRLMAAPTKEAQKELAGIGLSSTRLATDMRGPGGISAAILDLKSHLEGAGLSATRQAALIANAFGGKQSGAILTLIGNTGLLQQKVEAVAKGAKGFGSAWQAAQQTTAVQAAELKSSFQVLATSIGTGLLPAVNQVMSAISGPITAFAQWAAANPQLAGTILLVVGGVAALVAGIVFLGPVLGAVGAAIGAVGAVLGLIVSPVGLIVAAFVALGLVLSRVPAVMGPLNSLFTTLGSAIGFVAPYVGRLVGSIMDLVQGKGTLEQVGSAFRGLVGAVGDVIPGILSSLGELAKAFVAWVVQAIPPMLAALGQLAGQLIGWIGQQAPGWLAALGQWARAFVDWVAPMIPPALAALGQLVGQALGWIVQQVPVLLGQLAAWGAAFIDWIGPQIPPLLDKLLGFVTAAVNWIANPGIPMFVKALLEFAKNLVTWVGPQIPKLLTALGGLIGQVGSWIVTTGAPELLKAAVNLGASIVSGIVGLLLGTQGEPGLLQDLAGFVVNDLVPGILGFAGKLLDAAGQLGQSIVKGILDALAGLPKQVGDVLNQIPGVSLIGGIAGGAVGAAGNVLGALPHFAGGGIVSGPTLAVVGEGGPEAVIPLAGLQTSASGATGLTAAQLGLSAQASAVDAAKRAMALTAAQDAVARGRLGISSAERAIASARAAEASARTASAHEAAALRLQGANDRLASARMSLAAAEQKLALVQEEQALAVSKGTSGTSSKSSGSTTANAQLAQALGAFTAALLRAVGSGVPLTLDGQTVGEMLDRYAYTTAASSTSGFIAAGGAGAA